MRPTGVDLGGVSDLLRTKSAHVGSEKKIIELPDQIFFFATVCMSKTCMKLYHTQSKFLPFTSSIHSLSINFVFPCRKHVLVNLLTLCFFHIRDEIRWTDRHGDSGALVQIVLFPFLIDDQRPIVRTRGNNSVQFAEDRGGEF